MLLYKPQGWQCRKKVAAYSPEFTVPCDLFLTVKIFLVESLLALILDEQRKYNYIHQSEFHYKDFFFPNLAFSGEEKKIDQSF